MPGATKRLIDRLVEKRSNGNTVVAGSVRTKLILKGINPAKYTDQSEDDPAVLEKIKGIALEMSIVL